LYFMTWYLSSGPKQGILKPHFRQFNNIVNRHHQSTGSKEINHFVSEET